MQQEQENNVGTQINIDINNADQDQSGDKPKSMNLDVTSSRSRAGLTKEELMKFANQPFWVRLRNILFASFWILWVTILVVAIGYVVKQPTCLASAAKVTQEALNSTSTMAPTSASSG